MGWPFFDIKLVQFETNHWMQAAGLIHGFGDVVRPTTENWEEGFKEEVSRADQGLLKIMEWNRR